MLAPQGVANDTPAFADTYLLARDGEHLPLHVWAADNPKAVIVALHGMGDYSNAFAMPGEYWATQGITTLAIDQR
ncbi:MAG TPA: alpha/beta hydrolase, partial [Steroidobacteraceae bacterium]